MDNIKLKLITAIFLTLALTACAKKNELFKPDHLQVKRDGENYVLCKDCVKPDNVDVISAFNKQRG